MPAFPVIIFKGNKSPGANMYLICCLLWAGTGWRWWEHCCLLSSDWRQMFTCSFFAISFPRDIFRDTSLGQIHGSMSAGSVPWLVNSPGWWGLTISTRCKTKTDGNLLNFKRDPSDVSRKPAGNYLMCLEKSSMAFVLFCPRRLLCFSVLRLQMSPTELERSAGGKPCKKFWGWGQEGSLLKTNKQTKIN